MNKQDINIMLEVFPNNNACPAGCGHCLMARKPGEAIDASVHPEVVTSFKAMESVLGKLNKSYEIIYAGPVGSITQHFQEMVDHQNLISLIKCALDPKEPGSLSNHASMLNNQIGSLAKQFPNLALDEFTITMYPKDPYSVSEEEKSFLVELFKYAMNIPFMKKEHDLRVEIHANRIPLEEFVNRLTAFKQHDLTLYANIFRKITDGPFPDLLEDTYNILNFSGLSYYSKCAMVNFGKQSLYADHRILTSKQYPEGSTPYDIAIIQGKKLLQRETLDRYPNFSFAPEGVMIMHSSPMITNPVIWISHNEFRELLPRYSDSAKKLGEFARMIIETNLEFLEREKHYLLPVKAMPKFAQLRSQKHLQDAFS